MSFLSALVGVGIPKTSDDVEQCVALIGATAVRRTGRAESNINAGAAGSAAGAAGGGAGAAGDGAVAAAAGADGAALPRKEAVINWTLAFKSGLSIFLGVGGAYEYPPWHAPCGLSGATGLVVLLRLSPDLGTSVWPHRDCGRPDTSERNVEDSEGPRCEATTAASEADVACDP